MTELCDPSRSEENTDAVDCKTWLDEIGLGHYAPVFFKNFSEPDGKTLAKKKILNLRTEHLSSMNITNFEHQKAIIQHLKSLLDQNEFSPISKSETIAGPPRKKSIIFISQNRTDDVGVEIENRVEDKYKDYISEGMTGSEGTVQSRRGSLQSNSSSRRSSTVSPGDMSVPSIPQEAIRAAIANAAVVASSGDPSSNVSSSRPSSSRSTGTNRSGGAAGGTGSIPARSRTPSPLTRRASFDSRVWGSISKLRGNESAKTTALENLRKGIAESAAREAMEKPRRRWSVSRADEAAQAVLAHSHSQAQMPSHGSLQGVLQTTGSARDLSSTIQRQSSVLSSMNKGKLYGNLAQQLDIAQKDVERIQLEHINHFKDTIGCEIGNVLFLNEHTRELLLYDSGAWFRFPCAAGIEGSCAMTGSAVNVTDAYSDLRFNKNIDDATGVRTRNILCQPVRMNRGGGRVVGVVKMINKHTGEPFDESDQEILSVCVQRVADDLHIHFRDLMEMMDRFAHIAKLIVTQPVTFRKQEKSYYEQTRVSAVRRHSDGIAGMRAQIANRIKQSDTEKQTPVISSKVVSFEDKEKLVRKTQRRESYAAQLRNNTSSSRS